MKKRIMLLCFIGLLNSGFTFACDIDNRHEIQVGTSEGIAGECSNNAAPVQCISDGEGADRIHCDGPEGTFSGPNLEALIATACGCSASSNTDAAQQMQQEMGEP